MIRALLALALWLLASCSGVLVHEVKSEYSHIRVMDQGSRRALYFVDEKGQADVVQTLIDRKEPQRLQHAYARTLVAGLAYPPQTSSVLLVGLGGGAVVRFLNHHFPELSLDIVELDPAVVAVARDYFGTTGGPRTRIHVGDGRDFLQRSGERYDLILLDAHLHPSPETDKTGHPLSLQTAAFYRSLHERLRPGGAALFNIIARGHERAYIRSICGAFAATELLRTPSGGNVIVVARPAGPIDGEALRARARALDRRSDYGFSFERLLEERERADCPRVPS